MERLHDQPEFFRRDSPSGDIWLIGDEDALIALLSDEFERLLGVCFEPKLFTGKRCSPADELITDLESIATIDQIVEDTIAIDKGGFFLGAGKGHRHLRDIFYGKLEIESMVLDLFSIKTPVTDEVVTLGSDANVCSRGLGQRIF